MGLTELPGRKSLLSRTVEVDEAQLTRLTGFDKV